MAALVRSTSANFTASALAQVGGAMRSELAIVLPKLRKLGCQSNSSWERHTRQDVCPDRETRSVHWML